MKQVEKILNLNSFVNVFLTFIKIGVGLLVNSSLLVADGLHSASDLITDIFSIIGIKMSKKESDEEHPFGHGNLEYAFNLIVAMIIIGMIYELLKELVINWGEVSEGVSFIAIIVAFVTFVIKFLVSNYILKKSKELDSSTLRSSGLESRADAYSTIVVILGLALTEIGLLENINYLIYAEKIATIFVIFMLIKTAWEIIDHALVCIAGTKAEDEVVEKYREKIETLPYEVGHIEDILVMKNGIHYSIRVSLHLRKEISLLEAHKNIEKLRNDLEEDELVNKVEVRFDIEED